MKFSTPGCGYRYESSVSSLGEAPAHSYEKLSLRPRSATISNR